MIKKVLLIALVSFFFLGKDAYGQTINRGPYLQSVTTGSIYIKWRTDSATDSKVWWGADPSNLNNTVTSGSSTTEHELQITDLLANTTYYYTVGNAAGQFITPDFDHYFKTTPLTSTAQTIRAWVLGNAGHKNNNQRNVRDAYYNYIGNDHIDLMLLLGDNAYEAGTDADYQLSWFENMYEDRLINSVMWSAFGNHDGDNADSETETGPYYDIFKFPRSGEAGGVSSGTEAYYSFDYGNIHFISLNTWDIDRDPGEAMHTWLQSDLAATSQDWIVAMFHHPPYNGTGGNGSDNHPIETDMREIYVPILEAAGVDLVLSSHHHSYQRSFLINGHHDVSGTWNPNIMGLDLGDGKVDGDNAYYKEVGGDGTVYMVAGSAGDLGSNPAGYPAMYAAIQELGSVSLEVTDLQMDVKFIDENDNIGDYFTIIKQLNPPTVSITNPMDGVFYPSSPQSITIGATATDVGGSVSNVEFFIDDVSIGSDGSSPYTKNHTFSSDGTYEIKVEATDNDGNVAISKIKIRVGNGSVCVKVNKGSDDAEEEDDGSVNRSSGDLELVYDGNNQIVGVRFENLNIPQGAVINDAYIQFTSKNSSNENPRKLDIYGEDSDYPFSFGDNDDNVSDRTKTSASVSWFPNDWTSANQSGPDQKTLQIRSIIQEIVDRPGFSMDSPISIIIEGYGMRVAKSFEGDDQDAPELCIEYSNCPDGDGDGTCDANDICPGLEPGDPCDDGDAGTFNDLIQGDCSCVGISFDCPILQLDIGDPCDDGDNATYNDVVNGSCDCEGTQYECYPIANDIGDPCDDGNAGTYNDVYVGPNPCNCVGTSFDCPSLQADYGDPCDDGDANTNNDEIDLTCNCAGIPNGTGTLTSAAVASSSDDAEEKVSSGSVSITSSDLEMIIDGNDEQIVGIRFSGLNIPQGMFIQSAMIQFSADGSSNGNPCALEIYGHDIDNAPTFSSSGSNNISIRTKTTAMKTWSPDNWTNNQRGVAQRTLNLAPIVQEIVNRTGYTSSSAIAFIIEGTGKRKSFSFDDGGVTNLPELTVIYDLSGPLPIELLDITAKTKQTNIQVDWTTASEENNDYFTLERGVDGRNFEPIGTLPGKGTTSEINRYSFLDESPERGINYYRLKQTDYDGQFTYSKIVSAEIEGAENYEIYPSIVKDNLTILRGGTKTEESLIKIHDITGRSFHSITFGAAESETIISLDNLTSGVYYVSIYSNDSVETFKIVKL